MAYSLSKDRFHNLLANNDLTRLEKLLLILFWDGEKVKSVKTIQQVGYDNGLKECKNWNISDILGRSGGQAASIVGGWTLTTAGRDYLVNKNLITTKAKVISNEVSDLKTHAATITNPQTQAFIDEAIECLESDLLRAAVVLTWVGAVSLLYDEVVKNHLSAFNTEALRRDSKWKSAKNQDDLTRMKEADFLNVLEAISVIGKNVKQELEQCLKLRNGCGHPNSLKFGLRKVAAHIEILILNVFSKF